MKIRKTQIIYSLMEKMAEQADIPNWEGEKKKKAMVFSSLTEILKSEQVALGRRWCHR